MDTGMLEIEVDPQFAQGASVSLVSACVSLWLSVQGVSVSLMMQVRMAQCPAMEEQASARVPGVSLASGPLEVPVPSRLSVPRVSPQMFAPGRKVNYFRRPGALARPR